MGYWISQFVQVLIGYIFLMYLWPSVVFRKKLYGKSLTFRFAFCTTVSILLVNTMVLALGAASYIKGRGCFCYILWNICYFCFKKERITNRFSCTDPDFFFRYIRMEDIVATPD